MTQLLFFLHLGGYALWIGGALAQMMISIASRRMTRAELGTMARLQAAIAQNVVAPGAGATVLSGLILTFRSFPGAAGEMAAPSIWLMVMQLAGLLAGVLTLAVAVPGAFRVARIDPQGQYAAAFDALRTRQKVVGMLSGLLAVAALVGGVMLRVR